MLSHPQQLKKQDWSHILRQANKVSSFFPFALHSTNKAPSSHQSLGCFCREVEEQGRPCQRAGSMLGEFTRVHPGSSRMWWWAGVSHWMIPSHSECDSSCHAECHLSCPHTTGSFPLSCLVLALFFFGWGGRGEEGRRGREVLLVFFSHVSSGVKMCRVIKWEARKWLPAPHSPAPQMFVCQDWAYCLLTCPCCPERSSIHLAWPWLLPADLVCPWTRFLSWLLSFPLLWLELLWSA